MVLYIAGFVLYCKGFRFEFLPEFGVIFSKIHVALLVNIH